MTEKHLNRCSISLAIKEMYIQITLRDFILHLSEWQDRFKKNDNPCW